MSIDITTYRTDTVTGQLLQEKKCVFEAFNENGLLFKNNNHFFKSFQGKKITDVIKNKTEIANMYILAENMYKDTNMIAVIKNKKVKPASISDISILIDTCEKRTKLFLERMIKLKLIARDVVTINDTTDTQYYINPLYFMSSKRLTPSLYVKFRSVLDNELSAWAKSVLNDASNLHDVTLDYPK